MTKLLALFLFVAGWSITNGNFALVHDNLAHRECRINDLAEIQRKFALELYKKVSRSEGADKNVVLSPVVINMGLSMLLMGAANETEKDMLSAMFYNNFFQGEKEKEEISCIFNKYREISPNSPMTLHLASKLFVNSDENIDATFRKSTGFFGSKMEEVEFQSDPETARNTINTWVYQNTGNLINNMFPSGSIDSLTKLVMATALYFKGTWVTPFSKLKTGIFHISENLTVETTYMKEDIETRYLYDYDTDMELLELPYSSSPGELEVSLIVIPNYYSIGFEEVESRWTTASLHKTIKDLLRSQPKQVSVRMPKFRIEGDYDLKPHLQEMGFGKLFQQGGANLYGINGQHDLFVNDVKQKTLLKVDETGSEAAAAFGANIGVLSGRLNVVLYKPFHYILYEKTTQTFLFIGRVMNPNP